MAVIAFLPFGPLGGNDDAEPTNTPPFGLTTGRAVLGT